GEVQEVEQKVPANLPGHQWERRLDHFFRKWFGSPDQLCSIYLQRRDNTGYDTDEDCSQQNRPARVLNFLGQGGNAIESDVCEDSNRCAAKDSAKAESLRIVKGPREKSRSILVRPPEGSHDKGKEDKYHCDHAQGQRLVQAGGGLYTNEIEG